MSDAVSPSGQESGPRFPGKSQDVSRISDILGDPALDSRQVEVEPGAVFYEPQTPALNLFFIRSGQVRVFQPGRQTASRLLEILGPGDWFGVPALSPSSSTYGTRATAVSRV